MTAPWSRETLYRTSAEGEGQLLKRVIEEQVDKEISAAAPQSNTSWPNRKVEFIRVFVGDWTRIRVRLLNPEAIGFGMSGRKGRIDH